MDAVTKIGQLAPVFELPDLQGVMHNLNDMRGHTLILNFWSAECPWAERADREIGALLAGWQSRVILWSIASNVNERPEMVYSTAQARQLPIVLIDREHIVADLYGAITTPHLFLIDPDGLLRYQGALDDLTFRKRTATRYYLKEAVEALLAGRQPEVVETRPYGCTIVRYSPG